jgi:aminotransferase in exopolysaccharide biosynthesis
MSRGAPIPLSEPFISGNEWAYVKECLDSGWVSTAGSFVERFEEAVAEIVGSRHAVACASGTAALHVALRLAGVQPGDEVLVPTVTFIAPVNAVRYVGAEPVFLDADDFYNVCPAKLEEFLRKETVFRDGVTRSRVTGARIAAVVPVHVFGNAVDSSPWLDLCRERGVRVVEDASQALGTRYISGRLAGNHAGAVGDIGCLSFNGNKIVTTGGGGMLFTQDEELARRARYLTTQAKDDSVRFVHGDVGYNYRLTNVQAAIGVAQLEQLPRFLAVKASNYARYARGVAAIPGLALAGGPAYAENNHWMYALQIDSQVYGETREELMARLSGAGIATRPLWHLNHWQAQYRDCRAYRIEKAPLLLERTLSLPCSVGLAEDQVDRVLAELRRE